jgi:thiol-disulfide isomerase/thioredoxin
MAKTLLITLCLLIVAQASIAQVPLQTGQWRAFLHREDGQDIVFSYVFSWQQNKPVIYVLNAGERLEVTDILLAGDSVFIKMPFFESSFRARIYSKDSISGTWIKATPTKNNEMPFTATTRKTTRFVAAKGAPAVNVSGKWAVQFYKQGSEPEPAIGVFTQKDNKVTGSILTPTGDYRYLEGIVTGDSLVLSTFDGSHAFLLTAKAGKNKIANGLFYSGAKGWQQWQAVRNDTATLPDLAAMYLKTGEEGYLNFRFKDLEGKEVGITDERFKNKVVIIQLMGSWCPNCMDETAFLSDYYKKNKQRGIEIIALAYEYTTDVERSKRSLQSFQQRFGVTYPILNTGVAVTDPQRTEKTLPQCTPIKSFPTSLVLDRKGKVRKIDTGFFGPGTGVYYTEYKAGFEKTVNTLLAEK